MLLLELKISFLNFIGLPKLTITANLKQFPANSQKKEFIMTKYSLISIGNKFELYCYKNIRLIDEISISYICRKKFLLDYLCLE